MESSSCVTKKLFFTIILLLLFFTWLFAYLEKHIEVTLSPSVDHRIFWYDMYKFNPDAIKKGSYVMFRIPQNAQFYPNVIVTKIDMCDSGDNLSTKYYPKLNIAYYYCNGIYIGTTEPYAMPKKNDKVLLKDFIYNGKIPDGYFFAMGNTTNSYDSRYWGLINKNAVITIVKPIL